MPSEGRKGAELGFPNGHLVDGLDEVAKGLAAGTISRGRAIKLGGAALLGSMGLLSLFPHRAEGQGLCENKPAISNKRCPITNPRARCGACPTCLCVRTVSGKNRCVNPANVACPERDQCDTNRDCPNNQLGQWVCARVAGCCGNPRRNLCMPPCPTDPDRCPG
jgi:hypothetical protein